MTITYPYLAYRMLILIITAFYGCMILDGQTILPTGLHGTVRDQNGNVISGATVAATCGDIYAVSSTTSDGSYFMKASEGVRCTLQASAISFAPSGVVTRLARGSEPVNFMLRIETAVADVTVSADEEPAVSTDPDGNAGAIVFRSAELATLPDDPDDLMEDLIALAGPTGTGGVQLYTDGFTGHKLPPKSAIREIKINQNPYSAQFDHVGLGRIEILTKPGSNPVHGAAEYKISDALFDSRNPFAAKRSPYRSQLASASFGGPATQRLSYFLDFEDRFATNNAVVNAQVLSALLQPTALSETLLVPAQNFSLGSRFDWQANSATALTSRVEYTRDRLDVGGVGGFLLGSGGYASGSDSFQVQSSVTSTISRSTVNELRLQWLDQKSDQTPFSGAPTIRVLDSFTGGGAAGGVFHFETSLLDLRDYVSHVHGRHTLVYGGQARVQGFQNQSRMNFNGEYLFSGGKAPLLDEANHPVTAPDGTPLTTTISSLERFRRTLSFGAAGSSPATIRSLGGGASQYVVTTGNPLSHFTQFDFGAFLQDDWRIGSRLTVSAGLRWEGQNTVHRWSDVGPRLALAWMPGAVHRGTVIRVGSGVFFERFAPDLYVDTMRYDGHTQQRFRVTNPDFFPMTLPISGLEGSGASLTIKSLSSSLRSPYLIQSSLTLEQKLPGATVVAISGSTTLGRNLLGSSRILMDAQGGGPQGNNYQFVSIGTMHETELSLSFRRKYQHGLSYFGQYRWTHARGNTDGPESFPVSSANLGAEYGRLSTDVRHYVVLNGVMPGPLGTTLSPYVILRSGAPFNITIGHDNNGDSIFNDRPGISRDRSKPGLIQTRYGLLDPTPDRGEVVLPRNSGQGPGFAEMNLRLSRAFSLNLGSSGGVAPSAILHHGLFYVPKTPSGLRLGASITARNLFNRDNRGLPSGNLSSPLFDKSNTLSSATDPSLPAYGNNRRLQFEIRLDF